MGKKGGFATMLNTGTIIRGSKVEVNKKVQELGMPGTGGKRFGPPVPLMKQLNML